MALDELSKSFQPDDHQSLEVQSTLLVFSIQSLANVGESFFLNLSLLAAHLECLDSTVLRLQPLLGAWSLDLIPRIVRSNAVFDANQKELCQFDVIFFISIRTLVA